jgi:protein-disulfide isomerase
MALDLPAHPAPARAPLLLALLAACGGAGAPPLPAPVQVVAVAPLSARGQDGAASEGAPGPIPVTRADPTLGKPTALVTVVVFGDLEDPFYAGATERLRALSAREGPAQLRVSFKQLPMPWHPDGRAAALAAAAVFEVFGTAAFLRFQDALIHAPDRSPARFEALAEAAGVSREAYLQALRGPGPARKVDGDIALAESLKVTSGPWFFVNGISCGPSTRCTWMDTGRASSLTELIDAEMQKARELLDTGVPPRDLYATRCADNLAHPPPLPPPLPQPERLDPAGALAAPRELFGAKHLLVMYQGSRRASASILRTREEAYARAEEARKKARRGARFEDLVTEYSDEPNAAPRGGYLGKFPRGAMVPEFQAALETLKVGEISGVVETPFGFHVILRTE